MNKHILVIDDDQLLRRSLAFNLGRSNYRASTASTAEEGLALARRDAPDLVILDINLPGMDGLEALRSLQATMSVPVLFLTARRRELDEVLGLELGADDYITKPFDLDVLLARIKLALRRAQAVPPRSSGPLVVGDLVIDPGAHTVTVGGRSVDLPPRGFDLLHALASEAGRTVSVEDLLTTVWGSGYVGEPQVVYVHIRWLREKLEDDPQHPRRLVTVRGVGYKLDPGAC
jgi:DNA-binding response OmpR family regulator